MRLDHDIAAHLSASWNLRLQHREGNYLIYESGKATGILHPYGTHAILDCRLKWVAPRYELYADLHNVTRTRYFDIGNVPQPRFFVLAGCLIHL